MYCKWQSCECMAVNSEDGTCQLDECQFTEIIESEDDYGR